MSIKLPWADFKAFVDSKKVPIQFVDVYNSYFLKAFQGLFELDCTIDKHSPAGADQLDFETNYKAGANKDPVQRVQETLGELPWGHRGRGFRFLAPVNQVTTYDFLLDEAYLIKGGWFYSKGGGTSDIVEIQLVDKDNLLGAGAGFVLGNYIEDYHVIPDFPIEVEDISTAIMPLSGLYFRAIIDRTATASGSDSEIVINLKTWVSTP